MRRVGETRSRRKRKRITVPAVLFFLGSPSGCLGSDGLSALLRARCCVPVLSLSVCLSVCRSVCRVCHKPVWPVGPNLSIILCMLLFCVLRKRCLLPSLQKRERVSDAASPTHPPFEYVVSAPVLYRVMARRGGSTQSNPSSESGLPVAHTRPTLCWMRPRVAFPCGPSTAILCLHGVSACVGVWVRGCGW